MAGIKAVGGTALFGRRRSTVTTLGCFILGLAIGGGFLIHHQFRAFRQEKIEALTAIADLKAAQISAWYGERMSEARVIFKSATIQRQAVMVLERGADARARQELQEWMETVREEHRYQYLALYAADGAPSCVAPANESPPEAYLPEFLEAIRSGAVVAEGLRRDNEGGRGIHFDILIPVATESKKATSAKGVWLMRLDPYRSLYPLVDAWATRSTTAEILLVRQEGSDVLVLNELRRHPQSAGILRRSMDNYPGLAAAQAVKGREGIIENRDFRGVPTLAATRRVAGTPWSIVVKMDADEAYAPLRQFIWSTVLLGIVLAAIAAGGLLVRDRGEVGTPCPSGVDAS